MHENMSNSEYRKFMDYLKKEAIESNDEGLIAAYNEILDDRDIIGVKPGTWFFKVMLLLSSSIWLIEKLF